MTIRESLKLDMVQAENRYALIDEYYRENPGRIVGNSGINALYLMHMLYSRELEVIEAMRQTLGKIVLLEVI